MHELVVRIREPELCYVFAKNAIQRGHPELALQAYRRAVDLRAESQGAETDAELAAYRAIYAYEEALGYRKGKRTRATGTWQMVKRLGLFEALAKRINAGGDDDTPDILKDLGMEDYSFTAVREAFPDAFDKMAA